MTITRLAAPYLVSTILAGCAIHPLPQDVAGLDTYYIVRVARCEAKYAIIEQAIRFLRHDKHPEGREDDIKLAQKAQAMLDGEKEPIFKREFVQTANKDTREKFDSYRDIVIGYDFTFDITEDNKVGSTLGLLDAINPGPIKLGLSSSSDHMRHSTRNFQISDKFADLVGKELGCQKSDQVERYNYPITGKIGLNEVIKTFVDLNELAILSGKKTSTFGDATEVFADTLDFTTEIMGGATPSIMISPVKRGFGVTDASLTPTVDRKDRHTIIVALALPTVADAKGKTAAEPEGRHARLGELLRTRRPQTSDMTASQRVRNAIDDQVDRSLIYTLQQRLNQ